ncbi:MAG: hypothetical protein WBC13_15815 [Dokdonella sp.]|jgi:hypothetical protein|uniref:hypothetical protein n=1 Tax=Dokdonella sp. TaxID=2291710 RepID=UPI002DD64484|nr:hypothetical protein [Dokdonella sp.]
MSIMPDELRNAGADAGMRPGRAYDGKSRFRRLITSRRSIIVFGPRAFTEKNADPAHPNFDRCPLTPGITPARPIYDIFRLLYPED